MKKIISICFFSCLFHAAQAQLFQDASGESNLFLGTSPYGWVRVNTASESVTLGYNRFRAVGFDFPRRKTNLLYGADVKISVKDGTGNLLKDKSFQPGVSFNSNFGITKYDAWDTGAQLSIYLRPGIAYNQHLYVSNDNGAVRLDTVKKWAGQVTLNFAYFLPITRTKMNNNLAVPKLDTTEHYWIIGLATGYKRSNNFSALDDVTVNTYQFGNAQTYAVMTQEGKIGTYEGYSVMPLNIDIAYNPMILGQSTIGFNTYLRTDLFKPKNTVNLGVGTYLTKEDQPKNILGGLAWQFNDIGNRLKKDGSLIQRSSVFVYIGFTIGGK
jgi:hypothetical protein